MNNDSSAVDWRAVQLVIKRILMTRGVCGADLEDLGQEATRRMLASGVSKWANTARAASYARKVANSVLVDHHRAARGGPNLEIGNGPLRDLASPGDISDSSIQEYLHLMVALRGAIARLSPEELELLRALRGGPHAVSQLSRVHGVHRATILRRARRVLRSTRSCLLRMAETDSMLADVLTKRGFE